MSARTQRPALDWATSWRKRFAQSAERLAGYVQQSRALQDAGSFSSRPDLRQWAPPARSVRASPSVRHLSQAATLESRAGRGARAFPWAAFARSFRRSSLRFDDDDSDVVAGARLQRRGDQSL